MAGANHHGRKVFEDDAAGADYGAASDGDAGADKNAGGEPGFGLNGDEAADHVESGAGVVVVSRCQIAMLGDAGVVADADFAQGVERGVVADPAVVADGQLPGVGDFDRRTDDDAAADFGAEEAEKEATPSIEELRGPAEERGLDEPPKLHEPGGSAAKIARQNEALQILDGWRHRVKCRALAAASDIGSAV